MGGHLAEVQARMRYLRRFEPIGRSPPIPVERHVQPVTLNMQVPPIQIIYSGHARAISPNGGDWKTFAACAALGAAGGFMVLGGAAALSAAGIVGSIATSAAVGTGGALGSVAGAGHTAQMPLTDSVYQADSICKPPTPKAFLKLPSQARPSALEAEPFPEPSAEDELNPCGGQCLRFPRSSPTCGSFDLDTFAEPIQVAKTQGRKSSSTAKVKGRVSRRRKSAGPSNLCENAAQAPEEKSHFL